MNRAQRRALQRLPVTASPWEAALVDVPVVIDGVDTEGMFVLVEQSSGLARVAGPIVRGQPLLPLVANACTAPPRPCSPARPPRILCADRALARRLEAELRDLDVPVVRVDRVPAADHLSASLATWLTPPLAPGITVELELWASTLTALCRMAPWRFVSEDVIFRFAGASAPGLADAVAIVLGRAGEQRGIALFPAVADYERFVEAISTGDVEAAHRCHVLNLYIDPAGELEPAERARCEQAGLLIDEAWFPRLLASVAGRGTQVSEADQRGVLAAVEGIVGLCAGSLGRVHDGPVARRVSTCLGPIDVSSVPRSRPSSEPLLVGDHALMVGKLRSQDGRETPALVVKLDKKEALRLGESLAAVDRIKFEAVDGGYLARVAAGSRPLGALVFIAAGHDDPPFRHDSRALLCVSAGGPRRPRVRSTDFVYMKEVAVE